MKKSTATVAAMMAVASGAAITTLVAGPGASAVAPQASVRPATSGAWHTYHRAGDVAGVDSSGHIYKQGNDRVALTGTVRDTKHGDGERAALQIWATYADKGHRYELPNALNGSSQFYFTFASSVRKVQIQECLVHHANDGTLHYDRCARTWQTIWG